MNWQRKLAHPLKDKHGRELRTLHDARAYVLALGTAADRQHWRHAGESARLGPRLCSYMVLSPSTAALLRLDNVSGTADQKFSDTQQLVDSWRRELLNLSDEDEEELDDEGPRYPFMRKGEPTAPS